MAWPTVEEIQQDVIRDLGLVTGTGVQQYTEPMILQAMNNMFDLLCNKRNWEHMSGWDRKSLSGVDGLVSGAFPSIAAWEDIREIRYADSDHVIPRATEREHLKATGSRALYWKPMRWDDTDIAKWIRFYPLDATGDVDIESMSRPAKFEAPADTVPMNRLLICQGTLWYVLQGDGLNPANADKAQGMFDISYNDLISKIGEGDIGYGSSRFRRDDIVRIQ